MNYQNLQGIIEYYNKENNGRLKFSIGNKRYEGDISYRLKHENNANTVDYLVLTNVERFNDYYLFPEMTVRLDSIDFFYK